MASRGGGGSAAGGGSAKAGGGAAARKKGDNVVGKECEVGYDDCCDLDSDCGDITETGMVCVEYISMIK